MLASRRIGVEVFRALPHVFFRLDEPGLEAVGQLSLAVLQLR